MHDLPLLYFIEDRVRHAGAQREALIAELEAAGRRAAAKVLGDALDIEVRFDEDMDQVSVFVVCKVVKKVTNPARELTPAMVKAANLHATLGDELMFEVAYRWNRWDASFADPMPMQAPRFSHALGEAMLDELLAVFARHAHHTPTTFAPGTVGHALAHTTGWLRGYTHGGVTIERTFLWVHRPFPTEFYACWGAHLRRAGRVQVVWADQRLDGEALLAPCSHEASLGFTRAFRDACALLGGDAPGVEMSGDDWLAALRR